MCTYYKPLNQKRKISVSVFQQQTGTSSFYTYLLNLCFILFLVANILIFYYWYENNEPPCLQEGTCFKNSKSHSLLLEKWSDTQYFKVLLENFHRVNNEWRLILRQNSVNDLNLELNCSTLRQITDLKFVAAGWTKSTYKVKLNGMMLSMKTVNIDGHDVSSCLMEKDRYLYDCFLIAASKLLREISVLRFMTHPNIVKILGYCVPVEPDIENPHHTVAIFEEYGEPINVIKMLQLSWEDRLRISLGLSRLLKHLASFQEPIALNDFRRQQFVVIEGEPKLIDVDDVGLQEPKCNNTPCCFAVSSASNKTICVSCVNGVCHGYNEKLNIMRTGGHFIKHILPHGAPLNLNSVALRITAAFELATWNTDDILKEMEELTTAFKRGQYRDKLSKYLSDFKAFKHKDVSTDFDYRCHLTLSGYGCIISVHDTEEAAELCISSIDCKAFVITNVTTWTGRRIVHFKNGIGNFIDNSATTLYVKL